MITKNNFDNQFIFKGKVKIWSLAMIALGIIGIAYGFISGSAERTFANLLLMSYYLVSICICGICFCAVQYVSYAGWPTSILRIPQVFSRLLPIASVLLLLIITAGIFITHKGLNAEGKQAILPYLYKLWALKGITTPGNINYDAAIAGKSGYLNIPFFFIREVAYLACYSILGWLLVKYSLNEDKIGGLSNYKRSITLSCIFLVVFGVTVPLFAFDTIMSLEAHWYSTMFGWYNFGGLWVSGMAVIALTIIYLKEAGYMPWVTADHMHSLTTLIFAFSIFWTYLWFFQFLLMYYSNVPEEAAYFYRRWVPEFKFWFWTSMTINFCVPFFVNMSRESKRKMNIVKVVCIWIIIGHWLDYWQMIMPGTTGPQSHWYTEIGIIEATVFIGFVGLFIYLMLNSLSKLKSLAPKNHPFMEESLHHHVL